MPLARLEHRQLLLICALVGAGLVLIAPEPSLAQSKAGAKATVRLKDAGRPHAQNRNERLSARRRYEMRGPRLTKNTREAKQRKVTDHSTSDQHVVVLRTGESNRRTRKKAMSALPLSKMTPESRKRAKSVLKSVSVFRELPTYSFEIDPGVYQFFISHPDVAVSVWRVMGISEFQMWQTGPLEYEIDSGDGSVGVVDVLYHDKEQTLVLCEGTFKSPLIAKTIKAKALMHLESSFVQDNNGKTRARHRLKLFVSFPSLTVQTAAKIISPFGYGIIDQNFHEISLFLHMMSLAMSKQPGWVERIAGKLDGVLKVRKAQLLKLSARVYIDARRRKVAGLRPAGKASLKPPVRPIGSTKAVAPSVVSKTDVPSGASRPILKPAR